MFQLAEDMAPHTQHGLKSQRFRVFGRQYAAGPEHMGMKPELVPVLSGKPRFGTIHDQTQYDLERARRSHASLAGVRDQSGLLKCSVHFANNLASFVPSEISPLRRKRDVISVASENHAVLSRNVHDLLVHIKDRKICEERTGWRALRKYTPMRQDVCLMPLSPGNPLVDEAVIFVRPSLDVGESRISGSCALARLQDLRAKACQLEREQPRIAESIKDLEDFLLGNGLEEIPDIKLDQPFAPAVQLSSFLDICIFVEGDARFVSRCSMENPVENPTLNKHEHRRGDADTPHRSARSLLALRPSRD